MDNNRQQGKSNNSQGQNNSGGMPQAIFGLLIALVIGSFMFNVFSGETSRFIASSQSELSYNEFIKKVDDGSIYRVRIGAEDIYAYEKNNDTSETKAKVDNETELEKAIASMIASPEKVYHVVKVSEDKELVNRLLAKGNIEVVGTKASILPEILMSFAPFIILWILFGMFARRMTGGAGGIGSIFSAGQSKAKRYMQKETGVTFKDVAGEDEAKESLQEIVDFLHNPKKYTYVQ